ncbi:nucleoside-diphosphate-sugar epimerase [Frondihabitans sp. PhB188]|uniref:NAD-dependent epimerase/dehydratase family protein n=1 Tax=Frondihabitans sp. PhB188 TaxID=2485200 RepID=UPI000F476322|nr:NAD-dependent epimerase/dehydratase family protein [Frondihabitans sp. PhB188]ROQ38354.1 nucleoside-diphosphate-sugar epimerase [Frondihabitans sp. PhB188]
MKIVVIGATGHVGGYLVPRLVLAGHDVVAVSRGVSAPYRSDPAWNRVERIVLDREADPGFATAIRNLGADVVIDMVCFTPESAQQLVDALRGTGAFLVHCGTIWVHGPSLEVPITEDAERTPYGSYGVGKAAIEKLLLAEARRPGGLRSTVLHPGHITGPGWPMINAQGNLDLGVWNDLAAGREVAIPNFGLETVHHVHADDVAQAFQLAAERQPTGESFHVVSERAMTLRGVATGIARWYGVEPNLTFLPFRDFRATTTAEHADASHEHIGRSHSVSIEKARLLLGYAPRYTSLQAIQEGLDWLRADGQLELQPA